MTFATPSSPDVTHGISRIIIKPLNVAPLKTADKDVSNKPVTGTGSEPPALIMLGRDDMGKPHASRFGAADCAAATKAAELMGMVVLPIATPALAILAEQLPQGRVFASGKAFVPFVKRDLFAQLSGHVADDLRHMLTHVPGIKRDAAATPASSGTSVPAAYTLPQDWDRIVSNSLVLAYSSDDESWFEASVVETKGADDVVLRWRDWPEMPNFVRRRQQLALMHPSYAAEGVAR